MVWILLVVSINMKSEAVLPYATAFSNRKSCEKSAAVVRKHFTDKYGNAVVECYKEKIRK